MRKKANWTKLKSIKCYLHIFVHVQHRIAINDCLRANLSRLNVKWKKNMIKEKIDNEQSATVRQTEKRQEKELKMNFVHTLVFVFLEIIVTNMQDLPRSRRKFSRWMKNYNKYPRQDIGPKCRKVDSNCWYAYIQKHNHKMCACPLN